MGIRNARSWVSAGAKRRIGRNKGIDGLRKVVDSVEKVLCNVNCDAQGRVAETKN